MKKLIMVLAICCGLQATVTAQPHDRKAAHRTMTPEQRAQKQTEKMQEALQLSEAQKKAVYDLNLQTATEMQTARKADKEKNKQQFKAMHDRKEAKLKTILDAGQYSKYQSLKAERMNKMKQKRAEGKNLKQG